MLQLDELNANDPVGLVDRVAPRFQRFVPKQIGVPAAAAAEYAVKKATVPFSYAKAAGAATLAGVGTLWNTVWGGTKEESKKEASWWPETKKAESIGNPLAYLPGYASREERLKRGGLKPSALGVSGAVRETVDPRDPGLSPYLVVPLALLTVLVLARR